MLLWIYFDHLANNPGRLSARMRPAVPEPLSSISPERYRDLFEKMDDGFCIIEMIFDEQGRAADYRFLEHNSTFEQQTGLVGSVGKTARQLVPDLEQHWFDVYGKVATTGEALRFEQSSAPMNRWFNVYAFRLGDERSRQVAVMFSDVSARKFNELRTGFLLQLSRDLSPLNEERRIVHLTVNALGSHLNADRCYFLECQEEENLLVVSENYQRRPETSLEGILPLFDFGGIEWWNNFSAGDFAVNDTKTHPLTGAKAANYLERDIRSYMVQPFRHEGKWTVVLAVTDVSPRQWTSEEMGLVENVVSRVWPLVERARVAEKLRTSEAALIKSQAELEVRVVERTKELQETVNQLNAFSYSISHDLRAPLRAMRSYASILEREHGGELTGEGPRFLQRISVAAERMDRLILDVLDYSKSTQTGLPLETIALTPFIQGIIDTYPDLSIAKSHIHVRLPLASVRANPAALTQCIANLLGNAVKFSRVGVRPWIEVWTEPREDFVRLHIRDNGVGIDPSQHQKIFGIFYQVNPQSGSTGIGLSVVDKAVQRMGGRVEIESAPGVGSTFTLELRHPPRSS